MAQEVRSIFSYKTDKKGFWICPECETENEPDAKVCEACGWQRSMNAAVETEDRQIPNAESYRQPIRLDTETKAVDENKKSKSKRIVWLVLAIIAVLAVSAAIIIPTVMDNQSPQSEYQEGKESSEVEPSSKDSAEDFSIIGKDIKVGIYGTYGFFEWCDSVGNYQGVDVELITELLLRCGAGSVSITNIAPDQLFYPFADQESRSLLVGGEINGMLAHAPECDYDILISAVDTGMIDADAIGTCLSIPYAYHFSQGNASLYCIVSRDDRLTDQLNEELQNMMDDGTVLRIISENYACMNNSDEKTCMNDYIPFQAAGVVPGYFEFIDGMPPGCDMYGDPVDYSFAFDDRNGNRYLYDFDFGGESNDLWVLRHLNIQERDKNNLTVDYWFDEDGNLSYFVENELDEIGNIIDAVFYYASDLLEDGEAIDSVKTETEKSPVTFGFDAFLDTGWGDDEYALVAIVSSTQPITQASIMIYDTAGNRVAPVDSEELGSGDAGAHAFYTCIGGVNTDGSTYGDFIPGNSYRCTIGVELADGSCYYSDEYWFVYSLEGSRFL